VIIGGPVSKDSDEKDQPLLIDIRELSRLTGLRRGTLYHQVSEGKLPVVRLSSRCIRFRKSDIEQWILQHLVKPSAK
jgi:excisionase family DNA binding protein